MLFDLQPTAEKRLVGIARLAAESRTLKAKREVEYLQLPSRSILNRCSNPKMPFRWTINPYRGCEIGCKYCYARYTHEFMGMEDGRLFEERIYAKEDAAALLRADLRRKGDGGIAIGTSTDPYQPAERRFRLTRAILEVLAGERGRDLSITTKSDLAVRDIDLFLAIRERNELSVNVTVTTVDERLARLLEPRAALPTLRLRAVRKLADAGVPVGVFANPIMPVITSRTENLDWVAAEAKAAGATYFGGGTLFLMPSAKQQFFPFLEDEFPKLAEQYREQYERSPYLRGEYAERLKARVDAIRKKHGLSSGPTPQGEPDEGQMRLF